MTKPVGDDNSGALKELANYEMFMVSDSLRDRLPIKDYTQQHDHTTTIKFDDHVAVGSLHQFSLNPFSIEILIDDIDDAIFNMIAYPTKHVHVEIKANKNSVFTCNKEKFCKSIVVSDGGYILRIAE